MAELVKHYPIRSLNVIAHIRKATQGEVRLENAHPFQRELWGRYWIFAHNGNLKHFAPPLSGRFLPVGTTDSERAFCYILDTLAARFPLGTPTAVEAARHAARAGARDRQPGRVQLPALGWRLAVRALLLAPVLHPSARRRYTIAHLSDEDLALDFNRVTQPSDRVAIIATTALTDNERWIAIPPGSLLAFKDGAPVAVGETRTAAQDFSARGLRCVRVPHCTRAEGARLDCQFHAC